MSIRRQFILALTVFALVLGAAFGIVARSISSVALENELDRRLLWVAGSAVATGTFQAGVATGFSPGDEDEGIWQGYQTRLDSLVSQGYVSGAWIFNGVEKRALVSSAPADSIPIGTPLLFLEP